MNLLQVAIKKQQGDFRLDVSFNGAPAGITALFGPSGAGKTSVINMVAGLARPDRGRISVNGRCLFDSDRRVNLPPEKRRVGYIFQEGRIFPHLSVRSNLCYGLKLAPQGRRRFRLDEVVALLGIEDILERRPRHLSGGEKQRVAIGRALLAAPEIMLMDEPLAALDPARKEELLPFIARLSREFSIPILYVSHALEEIRRLTDHIVFLREGRLVEASARTA